MVKARGGLEAVALRRIPAGSEIVNDYRQALALLGVQPDAHEVDITCRVRMRYDMNDKVVPLVRIVLQASQTDLDTPHELSRQVYVRTIFIAAGTVLTGAAHSKDDVNIMHGDIEANSPDVAMTMEGLKVGESRAYSEPQ